MDHHCQICSAEVSVCFHQCSFTVAQVVEWVVHLSQGWWVSILLLLSKCLWVRLNPKLFQMAGEHLTWQRAGYGAESRKSVVWIIKRAQLMLNFTCLQLWISFARSLTPNVHQCMHQHMYALDNYGLNRGTWLLVKNTARGKKSKTYYVHVY